MGCIKKIDIGSAGCKAVLFGTSILKRYTGFFPFDMDMAWLIFLNLKSSRYPFSAKNMEFSRHTQADRNYFLNLHEIRGLTMLQHLQHFWSAERSEHTEALRIRSAVRVSGFWQYRTYINGESGIRLKKIFEQILKSHAVTIHKQSVVREYGDWFGRKYVNEKAGIRQEQIDGQLQKSRTRMLHLNIKNSIEMSKLSQGNQLTEVRSHAVSTLKRSVERYYGDWFKRRYISEVTKIYLEQMAGRHHKNRIRMLHQNRKHGMEMSRLSQGNQLTEVRSHAAATLKQSAVREYGDWFKRRYIGEATKIYLEQMAGRHYKNRIRIPHLNRKHGMEMSRLSQGNQLTEVRSHAVSTLKRSVVREYGAWFKRSYISEVTKIYLEQMAGRHHKNRIRMLHLNRKHGIEMSRLSQGNQLTEARSHAAATLKRSAVRKYGDWFKRRYISEVTKIYLEQMAGRHPKNRIRMLHLNRKHGMEMSRLSQGNQLTEVRSHAAATLKQSAVREYGAWLKRRYISEVTKIYLEQMTGRHPKNRIQMLHLKRKHSIEMSQLSQGNQLTDVRSHAVSTLKRSVVRYYGDWFKRSYISEVTNIYLEQMAGRHHKNRIRMLHLNRKHSIEMSRLSQGNQLTEVRSHAAATLKQSAVREYGDWFKRRYISEVTKIYLGQMAGQHPKNRIRMLPLNRKHGIEMSRLSQGNQLTEVRSHAAATLKRSVERYYGDWFKRRYISEVTKIYLEQMAGQHPKNRIRMLHLNRKHSMDMSQISQENQLKEPKGHAAAMQKQSVVRKYGDWFKRRCISEVINAHLEQAGQHPKNRIRMLHLNRNHSIEMSQISQGNQLIELRSHAAATLKQRVVKKYEDWFSRMYISERIGILQGYQLTEPRSHAAAMQKQSMVRKYEDWFKRKYINFVIKICHEQMAGQHYKNRIRTPHLNRKHNIEMSQISQGKQLKELRSHTAAMRKQSAGREQEDQFSRKYISERTGNLQGEVFEQIIKSRRHILLLTRKINMGMSRLSQEQMVGQHHKNRFGRAVLSGKPVARVETYLKQIRTPQGLISDSKINSLHRNRRYGNTKLRAADKVKNASYDIPEASLLLKENLAQIQRVPADSIRINTERENKIDGIIWREQTGGPVTSIKISEELKRQSDVLNTLLKEQEILKQQLETGVWKKQAAQDVMKDLQEEWSRTKLRYGR